MKILNRILTVLGILIILLIVAAVMIPIVYRDEIEDIVKQEISERSGATVNWKDLQVSLLGTFPHLTLKVGDFTLTPKDISGSNTIMSMKEIELGFDVLSVIRGIRAKDRIEVRTLRLSNPKVFILVTEKSPSGPEGLGPGVKMTEGDISGDGDSAPAGGVSERASLHFALEEYSIEDAQITYKDGPGDAIVILGGFTHRGKGDFASDVFDLQTTSHVDELTLVHKGVPYLNKVLTDVRADVRIENMKNFTLRQNEIRLNALSLSLDGSVRKNEKGYELNVNFRAPETDFRNILSLIPVLYRQNFSDIKTDGTLSLSGKVGGRYSDSNLPAFKLDIKVQNGMFQYPGQPVSARNIGIDAQLANVGGDLDNTLINVRAFHAEIAGEPFDAVLVLKNPVSDPYIDTKIKGKVDLDRIRQLVPLEDVKKLSGSVSADLALKGKLSELEKGQYDRFRATGRLAARNVKYATNERPEELDITKLDLSFNPEKVSVEELVGGYGKSDIRASGHVENLLSWIFRDQALKGRLECSSRVLDLDELTGSGPGSETPAKVSGEESGAAGGVVRVPDGYDLELAVSASRLFFRDFDLKNVRGSARLAEGIFRLNNLEMEALGGSTLLSGRYDTRNIASPRIELDVALRELDIGQVFKSLVTVQKFAPVAEYASGRFTTSAKLRGSLGQDMTPVYESIEAEGVLDIIKAVVGNFAPLTAIAGELNQDRFKSITLENLKQSFTIREGRLYLKEFGLDIYETSMKISGSNGLDRSLDYLIKMAVPRSVLGARANQFIDGLLQKAKKQGVDYNPGQTIRFNLILKGTFDHPTISTDLKGQARDVAQEALDAARKKLEEEAAKLLDEAQRELEKKKKEAERILSEARAKAQVVKDQARKAADKLRAEGYAKAAALESEATDPVSKQLTKLAADKMRKQTDQQSQRIIDDADQKAQALLDEAQARVDKLLGG